MVRYAFILAGLAVMAPSVLGGALTYANGYNVFLFGNATISGSDTGGSLAAAGNVTISSGVTYSIAQAPMTPSTYGNSSNALVVGGQYSGNTALASGDAWLGSKASGANIYFNCGCGQTSTIGGTSPIDFASAQSSLTSQSSLLVAQVNNGTLVAAGNALTISTGLVSGSTYYVTLTAAQLSAASALNITISPGTTLVVNVTGTSVTLPSIGMTVNGAGANGDSSPKAIQSLLFNFNTATSINFGSSFLGTILAPAATVSTNASYQLDGELIANSFSDRAGVNGSTGGAVEFHNFYFNGSVPGASSVPEPGTWIMSGLGLLAVGVRSRGTR